MKNVTLEEQKRIVEVAKREITCPADLEIALATIMDCKALIEELRDKTNKVAHDESVIAQKVIHYVLDNKKAIAVDFDHGKGGEPKYELVAGDRTIRQYVFWVGDVWHKITITRVGGGEYLVLD